MSRVRPFQHGDWPAVQRIYQEGIDTGNATFQAQVKSWQEWDASMLSRCRLVILAGDEVAGWAGLSAVSHRAVYAGVAEVSIYIAATRRGQGLGKHLLAALVEASEEAGFWTLQAGVFPENRASIVLHERCGFRQVGLRRRLGQMADGRWRDVVLLERRSSVVGC